MIKIFSIPALFRCYPIALGLLLISMAPKPVWPTEYPSIFFAKITDTPQGQAIVAEVGAKETPIICKPSFIKAREKDSPDYYVDGWEFSLKEVAPYMEAHAGDEVFYFKDGRMVSDRIKAFSFTPDEDNGGYFLNYVFSSGLKNEPSKIFLKKNYKNIKDYPRPIVLRPCNSDEKSKAARLLVDHLKSADSDWSEALLKGRAIGGDLGNKLLNSDKIVWRTTPDRKYTFVNCTDRYYPDGHWGTFVIDSKKVYFLRNDDYIRETYYQGGDYWIDVFGCQPNEPDVPYEWSYNWEKDKKKLVTH